MYGYLFAPILYWNTEKDSKNNIKIKGTKLVRCQDE